MKSWPVLLSIVLMATFASAQADHERWDIKTNPAHMTPVKHIELNGLLGLDGLNVPTPFKLYDTKLITTKTNKDFVEGQAFRTEGWVQVVGHEADGDYHLQLVPTQAGGSPCFIVEVPDPDDPATKKSAAHDKIAAARSFVEQNLLHGAKPSKSAKGNDIGQRAYITVTGQLYYDLPHQNNNNRGRGGCDKKASIWELHPVFQMAFAPRPAGSTKKTEVNKGQ